MLSPATQPCQFSYLSGFAESVPALIMARAREEMCEFCATVGPAARTACILTQSGESAGC